MATPLDITALRHFEGVFPFLFVLVIGYAVLSRLDWFKDKQGLAAIVALLLSVMTLLSPIAIRTVQLMAPWVVVFIIFIVIIMLTYMAIGLKSDEIAKFISDDKFGTSLWITTILLIIAGGSLYAVWTEETGGFDELRADSGDKENLFNTLFHPNMLGLVLVLLISMMTIRYMTE